MSAPRTRHQQKVLSAAFVKSTTEQGKHFDGNGLYLFVKSNGAKQWVQRIHIRGKRTEMGLGSTALVTLAQARELAQENRKLARAGGDPLRAKREAKAIMTFEEAAREVHRLNQPSWKNAKHAAQFISTLETYAFPTFGNHAISDVSTSDVLAALSPIWLTKQETARRVRQRIGTVMKWAIAQGWRQDNPAENISQALPKQTQAAKHRKSLPYSKVHECINAVKASGAGISTKQVLEFLVLTAARSGEARLATWEEFDLGEQSGANCANDANQGTWTIPAERMKMKREHRVPLPSRAIEILTEAKALTGGEGHVFPSVTTGKPLSDMTLSKLVKSLGFDVDVHGFRTSFRTWVQEQTNAPREVAEAALAHAIKDKSEAAYARSDLFEKRRELMNDWATFICEDLL